MYIVHHHTHTDSFYFSSPPDWKIIADHIHLVAIYGANKLSPEKSKSALLLGMVQMHAQHNICSFSLLVLRASHLLSHWKRDADLAISQPVLLCTQKETHARVRQKEHFCMGLCYIYERVVRKQNWKEK